MLIFWIHLSRLTLTLTTFRFCLCIFISVLSGRVEVTFTDRTLLIYISSEKVISKLISCFELWNDHLVTHQLSPLSTGGRLHGIHAQPKRTWPGKGCQEEGGALRPVCGEGGGGLGGGGGGGCCTAQFVIALWPLTLARALSALTWETWWPQRKAIFYTVVITFVIIPTEYLQSDRPLETSVFFMDILTGRKDTDTKKSDFIIFSFLFVFFFCPNTVTAYVKKLHPIQYLCNTDPCLALWGYLWLTDTQSGGWWSSVVKGGGYTVRHFTRGGPNQVTSSSALPLEDTHADYCHTHVFNILFFCTGSSRLEFTAIHPEYCFVILTDQFGDKGVLTQASEPSYCMVIRCCSDVRTVISWTKGQYFVCGSELSWLLLLLDIISFFFFLLKFVALQILKKSKVAGIAEMWSDKWRVIRGLVP